VVSRRAEEHHHVMAVAPRHRQLDLAGCSLHVVEGGDPAAPPILFLHGWPQSWLAWRELMARAGGDLRTLAIDLPGIGGSQGATVGGGSKRALAEVVRALVTELELADLTVVGHDVGGMVAYAYLRAYDDAAAVVVMDVVIPGLEPWEQVRRNPSLWHVGLHAVPGLPEALVQGRQARYFGWFYDAIAADPARITADARAAYAEAYAADAALTAGFDWYRAFDEDAADNRERHDGPAPITPLLYLRGEREGGDIGDYAAGFAGAGIEQLACHVLPGAGHFAPEEAPDAAWERIADFIGL
jgi:pimeloyl-ACP methyl ester carboxylesterase